MALRGAGQAWAAWQGSSWAHRPGRQGHGSGGLWFPDRAGLAPDSGSNTQSTVRARGNLGLLSLEGGAGAGTEHSEDVLPAQGLWLSIQSQPHVPVHKPLLLPSSALCWCWN